MKSEYVVMPKTSRNEKITCNFFRNVKSYSTLNHDEKIELNQSRVDIVKLQVLLCKNKIIRVKGFALKRGTEDFMLSEDEVRKCTEEKGMGDYMIINDGSARLFANESYHDVIKSLKNFIIAFERRVVLYENKCFIDRELKKVMMERSWKYRLLRWLRGWYWF